MTEDIRFILKLSLLIFLFYFILSVLMRPYVLNRNNLCLHVFKQCFISVLICTIVGRIVYLRPLLFMRYSLAIFVTYLII